jgi:hypothetical protein
MGSLTAVILFLAPASGQEGRLAQLPRYTASGTHQCGGAQTRRTCVVTGTFSTCSDAAISLQTRDCCPTTRDGGKSSGFSMSYCIPEIAR